MNIIKQKRKELGISQKELSEKLGTSQQTVSRMEKGDVENIPSSTLKKLASIFQVPIDILVLGEKSALFNSRADELWDIYNKLDEINKTTLIVIGKRLKESQAENILKKQTGEKSDKNSDMR